MVHQQQLNIETNGHGHMQNLTVTLAEIVRHCGINTGLLNVSNVGSTGAVGTIEFEPGLEKDLPAQLDRLLPPNPSYGHAKTAHDDNAHSHLQATMLGPSVTIPIMNGTLALGTWQHVFHIECDVKSHRRPLIVTVIGE